MATSTQYRWVTIPCPSSGTRAPQWALIGYYERCECLKRVRITKDGRWAKHAVERGIPLTTTETK